jgi:hypothetical protein
VPPTHRKFQVAFIEIKRLLIGALDDGDGLQILALAAMPSSRNG